MVSTGYSPRQIALHWIVFVLVAYQFVAGDHMTKLFQAAHGGAATGVASVWAPIHIAFGVAILAASCGGFVCPARSGRRCRRSNIRRSNGWRARCMPGFISI
jgi:cytochrome b561